MSLTSLKESDIGKSIMSALKKIGGSAGASLEDIKEYLPSQLDKAPDMESVKTWLNGAVDKGIVSLSGGKYKLKDANEYAQQAGQAIVSKVNNSKDKMKDSVGSAEEAAEGKEKNEETAKRPCSDDEKKYKLKECKEYAQQAGQAIVSKVTNSKDKMKDSAESAEEAAEGKEKNEETAKRPCSDDEKKYKLKECKEYAQQAGQAIVSKVTNSKDKMKDSVGSAEEAAEGKEKNEKTAKRPCSDHEKKYKLKECKDYAQQADQVIVSKVTNSKDKMKDSVGSAEEAAEGKEKNEETAKRPCSDDEKKYKLKECKDYAQQAGQVIVSKVTNSKDKMKDSVGSAEEAAEGKEKNEETAKRQSSDDKKK